MDKKSDYILPVRPLSPGQPVEKDAARKEGQLDGRPVRIDKSADSKQKQMYQASDVPNEPLQAHSIETTTCFFWVFGQK